MGTLGASPQMKKGDRCKISRYVLALMSADDERSQEFAELVRDRATTFIGSADAKATGLLAAAAALLALLVALANADLSPDTSASVRLLFGLFALLLSGSVIASALVLWPRTNRYRYVEKTAPKSLTFFQDVSSQTLQEFHSLSKTGVERERLHTDLLEQSFILAKIATAKLWWMRWSVGLLIASLAVLFLMISARLIPTEQKTSHANEKPTDRSSRQDS